jgi:hypothetical protein
MARLQWDLNDPNMFIHSRATNYLSINIHAYHSDDITAAASKDIDNRKRLANQNADEYIYSSVYLPIVKLLTKEISDFGSRLKFSQHAIRCLFGIDSSKISIPVIRAKIVKLEYSDRLKLVRDFVTQLKYNNRTNVSTKRVNKFLQERNVLIKKRAGQDIGKCCDNSADRRSSSKPSKRLRMRDNSVNDNTSTGCILTEYIAMDARFCLALSRQWDLVQGLSKRTVHLDEVVESLGGLTRDHFVVEENNLYTINRQMQTTALKCKTASTSPIAICIDKVLSQDFITSIMADLDCNTFVQGKKGRANSYLRIVTTHDNTENVKFQVGKSLYSAQAPTTVERKLLTTINSLQSFQNKIATATAVQRKSTPTRLFLDNTIQILVEYISRTSGYSRHSDCGRLLNSVGSVVYASENDLERNEDLPFPEESQTYTIVLYYGTMDPEVQTHRIDY